MEQLAGELRARGVRVFYDKHEQVELWGKDLYVHLSEVYSKTARYCIMFISTHYVRKMWAKHQRASAQERALQENREYILPVRFDDAKLPGLLKTIGYLDLNAIEVGELANIIVRKFGTPQRSEYLPPEPDLLFRSFVERYGEVDLALLRESADHFLEALRRTNEEERNAIVQLFLHGCSADLPVNIHMNIDLLARITGLSERRLVAVFAGLRSLGFYSRAFKRRKNTRHIGEDTIISVEWRDMYVDSRLMENATSVAYELMNVTDFSHCEDCALQTLRRLDFSHLSTYTLNASIVDVETGRPVENPGLELRRLHPLKHYDSVVKPAKKAAKKKATRPLATSKVTKSR